MTKTHETVIPKSRWYYRTRKSDGYSCLVRSSNRKRRVVIVDRERGGRTLSFVVRREAEGAAIVRQIVAPGSTVHGDEAAGWDVLHAHYEMRRINHSGAFSRDGACTNQAKSYFACLRRVEIG